MNFRYTEKVLEIGPGAYPFWRSDCLTDIYDEQSNVDLTQFGGAQLSTKGKPLFLINNGVLPFRDNSFDYVICSHVFEHVSTNDLSQLCSEIMRVSKKAYIEFPRPLYDFVYNFDVHVNLMDIVNGEIICLEKSKSKLSDLKLYQKLSIELRKMNRWSIDEYFAPVVAVGKEFVRDIPLRIVDNEKEFFERIMNNNYYIDEPSFVWRIYNKIRPSRVLRTIMGERKREYFYSRLADTYDYSKYEKIS